LRLLDNAIPVFLVFTDENDDLPVSIERGRLREPPKKWLTDPRAPQFQARLDEVSERLIALHARAIMLVNRHNRPTEFQYGASRATAFDSLGHFDVAGTLATLQAQSMQNSIQGQLLASGICGGTSCVQGRIGFACTLDTDCGLPVRAYDIQLARRKGRDVFFQNLRNELIDYGNCPP
jgi:hypothetical protein